jgi:hypothetical protein
MGSRRHATNLPVDARTADAMEAAVMDIAWSRPGLVVFRTVIDGRTVVLPQHVVRPGPRPRGREAVNPADLREQWQTALDKLASRGRRPTLEAIAEQLHVSPRTAARYRKRYGLS